LESRLEPLHATAALLDLIKGDFLGVTGKVVVFCQEEHAVALLALAHRHTRAVPEALLSLKLLVVVMAARAERHPQLILVLC